MGERVAKTVATAPIVGGWIGMVLVEPRGTLIVTGLIVGVVAWLASLKYLEEH